MNGAIYPSYTYFEFNYGTSLESVGGNGMGFALNPFVNLKHLSTNYRSTSRELLRLFHVLPYKKFIT